MLKSPNSLIATKFDWLSHCESGAQTHEELKPTIAVLEQMSADEIFESLWLPLYYALENASKEGPSEKSLWSHEKLLKERGEIESMLYEFSKNIKQHRKGEG